MFVFTNNIPGNDKCNLLLFYEGRFPCQTGENPTQTEGDWIETALKYYILYNLCADKSVCQYIAESAAKFTARRFYCKYDLFKVALF